MIRLLRPSRSDEDLFRESTMTFGEHLEELRSCLFRAIGGLAIGFLIGLMFGNQVVQLIQLPLQKALTKHYLRQSQQEIDQRVHQLKATGQAIPFEVDEAAAFLQRENLLVDEFFITPGQVVPELVTSVERVRNECEQNHRMFASLQASLEKEPQSWDAATWENWEKALPLLNSLTDDTVTAQELTVEQYDQLAKRVKRRRPFEPELLSPLRRIVPRRAAEYERDLEQLEQTASSWESISPIFKRSLNQLDRQDIMHVFVWRRAEKDPRIRARSLSPHEAFSIWMRASLLVGAILASPWIFWQIWAFVATGLYRHERRFVYTFLPFSVILFITGAGLAFLFVFEPVLSFLFRFNEWMGIELEPRISEWLRFVLILPLGFGIGFQLPLVMLFLERIGVFSLNDYWSKWRIAMVVIFTVSALLTPPDPSSQLMMAIPLTLLYFGGILLCKFMPRRNEVYSDN